MNEEHTITLKIRETSLVALIVGVIFIIGVIAICIVGSISNYIDNQKRTIEDYDVWKTHEYYSWMYDYCPNCGEKLKVVQEKEMKNDE